MFAIYVTSLLLESLTFNGVVSETEKIAFGWGPFIYYVSACKGQEMPILLIFSTKNMLT